MPGIWRPSPPVPPKHDDSPIGWVASPLNPNNTNTPLMPSNPIVSASQAHDIPLIRAGQRGAIVNLGPLQQQKLLRSMGFHVQMDGRNGPQTHSAVWAFVHGHNAGWYNNKGADWQQAVWNKFAVTGARPQATAHTTPVHPNNSHPPQPSDAQASGPSPMERVINSALGASGKVGDGTGIGTILDRAKAGASAAELGYGSTIRDLEKNIHLSPLQAAAHQRDIASWYTKLRSQMATGAKDEASTADALIASQSGAGNAVAQSFGGAGQGDLTAAADAETGNLRALKLIGATSATNMDSAAGEAGISAGLRKASEDAALLSDYRTKLADATAQSGATYEDAASKADQLNAQTQQQRYQNKIASQQARIAAIASGATLAIKQQTADAATARANAYTKAKATVAKLPKGSWAATTASDKGKVADAALQAASSMAAAGHTTAEIRRQIAALYASRGWSLSNPAVQRAMSAVLAGVPPQKK